MVRNTLLLLASLVALSPSVFAQFSIDSRWNGVSEFVSILMQQGARVDTPAELYLDDLTSQDTLVLLGASISSEDMGRFLRTGGRAIVSIDTGEDATMLRAFGFDVSDFHKSESSELLRSNEALPLAHTTTDHPLAARASRLVSNHPRVLSHRTLMSLYEFGPSQGLVVVGAVGDGRLIAVADTSIFINNMLEFAGNRNFAQNLGKSIEGRTGRVYLVTSETRINGSFMNPSRRKIDAIRRALIEWSRTPPDSRILRILSLLALSIVVTLSLGAIQKRSPYGPEQHLLRTSTSGERSPSALTALLALRSEFDVRLRAAVRADANTPLSSVLARLPKSLERNLNAHFESLDHAATQRVSPRALKALLADEKKLLEEVTKTLRSDPG